MSSALSAPAIALTIAGSDSGGGAGLQADLRTWENLGVFGSSVVTCVTAQNTREVRGIEPVSGAMVRAQLEAVFDDLPIAAAKTGLLPTGEIVREVSAILRVRGPLPLVVDPVLRATSGDRLVGPDAADAIFAELLPLATVLTPNLDEASRLSGRAVRTLGDMRAAATSLVERGASAVLVKGGHLGGAAVDLLLDEAGFAEFAAERLEIGPCRGTGCTLAAAIAAGLARGAPLREAIGAAKRFVHAGLASSRAIGGGARVLGRG